MAIWNSNIPHQMNIQAQRQSLNVHLFSRRRATVCSATTDSQAARALSSAALAAGLATAALLSLHNAYKNDHRKSSSSSPSSTTYPITSTIGNEKENRQGFPPLFTWRRTPFSNNNNNNTRLDEVRRIELRRQRENELAMKTWDLRWQLRMSTLRELRGLAAERGVVGRSKMKKEELVRALEEEMGLSSAKNSQLP